MEQRTIHKADRLGFHDVQVWTVTMESHTTTNQLALIEPERKQAVPNSRSAISSKQSLSNWQGCEEASLTLAKPGNAAPFLLVRVAR